jgi:hypothetical protein
MKDDRAAASASRSYRPAAVRCISKRQTVLPLAEELNDILSCMSYEKASQCFQDNLKMIPRPMEHPQEWNLNTGLVQLTEAIQADLAQVQSMLVSILRALEKSK